ncbi:MAG: serine/threonine-protein kinase [Phototrophicaceae bacterium]
MNIRELAGLEIDEYKLVSIIGQGGMSAVYRAYQEELDRDVAIKILSDELAQDPNYIKRFQQEAKMSAALEHPHIVPVYDFGIQDELTYVAMRLLRSTLTDKMYASQAMSMNDLLVTLEQVAKALDYAHSKGIVHRDVKPSNIMFDDTKTTYLVDFGIAKATQQADTGLTAEHMVLGTPSYMSPELWRGDAPIGSSDQYALAVVVYQVLTGQLPFQADSPSAVMYKHLNEKPPIASQVNPHLSPAVDAVIHRGMHKDARQRYPLVSNFVNALTQAILNPASAVETQERPAVVEYVPELSAAELVDEPTMQQTVPIQAVPRPAPEVPAPSRQNPASRALPRPRRPKNKNRSNTVMMQVASGGIIGLGIILLLAIIGLGIALYIFSP